MTTNGQESKVEGQEVKAQAPETQPLLLEIGCEEIPARFLADAQRQLGALVFQYLDTQNLLPVPKPTISTYSTPRRLILYIPRVLEVSTEFYEVKEGPPVRIAFGPDGTPTRAAEGFAKRMGVPIRDLQILQPEGTHVGVRRKLPQVSALHALPTILSEAVEEVDLPKSMYWTAKAGPRFFRPVRWILALLGEGNAARVVRFQIAGVKSGKATCGHRASGGRPIQVTSFGEYAEKLRAARVEIEPENRGRTIRESSKALLEASEKLVADAELETWHVNSAEWPSAIRGGFNQKFLRLPREILITVMRDHQKYFAVEAGDGNLRPGFIAILNRQDDPKGIIRAGHERVLRARFTDAEFFWDTDQKLPLRDRAPLLEKVTYHEKLGSYGDKVRRMEAIAREVCAALESQGKITAEQKDQVFRAIQLCKCDLTTQMVKEFTELQGVVGGLYAKAQGEPLEVADAIYDHYLPQGAEDKCPRSTVGAIVALADKLDTIVAGFGAGLEPSGSSDPFGLRRAGNGVVKIAVEALPGLDVRDCVRRVVMAWHGTAPGGAPVPTTVAIGGFLQERAEYYLRTSGGLRGDTVRAVVHSFKGWSPPSDALLRGRQLEPFVTTEAFQALAIAAKRTRNILSKSATQADRGDGAGIEEQLLSPGPERDLFEAYCKLKADLDNFAGRGMYGEAFAKIAEIRPVVDRFFDKVMVMDEDLKLRANRLRLLDNLNALVFLRFADLSQIESSASTVGAPTRAGDE